jgi:hypothetical protein
MTLAIQRVLRAMLAEPTREMACDEDWRRILSHGPNRPVRVGPLEGVTASGRCGKLR